MPSKLEIIITEEPKHRISVNFDFDCTKGTRLEACLLDKIEQAVHSCLEYEFDGPPIEIEETPPVMLQ